MTAQLNPKLSQHKILHNIPFEGLSVTEALDRYDAQLLKVSREENPALDIYTERFLLDEAKMYVDQLNTLPPNIENIALNTRIAVQNALKAMVQDYERGVYSVKNVLLLDDIFEGAYYFDEKSARYGQNDCVKGNGKCKFSVNVLKRLGMPETLPGINAKREWDEFYSTFFCIRESPDYKELRNKYQKERLENTERFVWESPAAERFPLSYE